VCLSARGRPAAPVRLRQLAGLAGADSFLDRDVAVWEAELAGWQGDLERARSAIRRGLAAADAVEIFDQALEGAWVAMNGLSVEADRAEQAPARRHAAPLAHAAAAPAPRPPATAPGRAPRERARADAEQAPRAGLAHDVHVRGRLAKAEAE